MEVINSQLKQVASTEVNHSLEAKAMADVKKRVLEISALHLFETEDSLNDVK